MTATLLGNIKGPKGDTGLGIASIAKTGTSGLKDTYTITYTDNTTSTIEVTNGAKGETGAQGIQGPKGDDGEGFAIEKTYASISAMNADAANIDEGKFVLIASAQGAEDEDNAKLYVKGASSFTYLTDLSGAQGVQGKSISTVEETSVSGTQNNGAQRTYNVKLSDNTSAGTFIVKDGLKGDTGTGISSITKTGTSGLEDTYTITLTNGTTETMTVTNGATGATGATGPTGATGDTGLTPVLTMDSNGNLYVEYMTQAQFQAQQSGS